MRLVIEALGIGEGGGGIILQDVLSQLAMDREHEITLLTSSKVLGADRLPRHVQTLQLPLTSFLPWRACWAQLFASRSAHVRPADVLLSMSTLTVAHSTPTVMYVQNALPFVRLPKGTLPFRTRVRYWILRRLMGRAVSNATVVAVQTQWMADHLRSSRRRGLEPPIVVVKPDSPCRRKPGHTLSWPLEESVLAGRHVVLYVGSTLPHKNLRTLMAAWTLLRSIRGPKDQLWITGHSQEAAPDTSVRYLGSVHPDTMCSVYEQASIVVQPSLAETVGLPLLEAMSHGRPVVAADLPYAREVMGHAALYFSPLSAQQLGAALASLLENPVLRHRLGHAGRQRFHDWHAPPGRLRLSHVLSAVVARRSSDLPQ